MSVLFILLACGGGETPAAAAGVELDRDVVTLSEPGAMASVGAFVTDEAGNPMPGHPVTWWSSNPAVATVSENGAVTAVGDGIARIWASAGDDSVFTVVVVELKPEIQFAILPTVVRFDALGDTAQLRVEAVAPTPDSLLPVESLETFCQSVDAGVAYLAEGGMVQSVANGVTQVRCQVGESTESLRVEVQQRASRVAIISDREFAVRLQDDSLELTLARVDRRGEPILGVQPSWTSLDPDILQVDPKTGTAYGLQVGEGRVTATLQGRADTAVIAVVERLAARTPAFTPRPRTVSRAARGRAGAVRRASLRSSLDAEIGARSPLEIDSIFTQQFPLARVVGERRFAISASVMQAEHRVDFGIGTERTSGLLFGGEVSYIPGRVGFTGRLMAGKLTADSVGVSDRRVTDGEIEISVRALPWLDFKVGVGRRAYKDDFDVTQRWTTIVTGGRARFDLMEGTIRALFDGALLPSVTVTNTASPSLGFVAGAGVEYRAGRLVGGVYYRFERYDFPRAPSGVQRREQLTGIKLRVGLEF